MSVVFAMLCEQGEHCYCMQSAVAKYSLIFFVYSLFMFINCSLYHIVVDDCIFP